MMTGHSRMGSRRARIRACVPDVGRCDTRRPWPCRQGRVRFGRKFRESRMDMTPSRWRTTASYLIDVFGAQDDQLATLTPRAIAAGLPDIAVSPDVGRLLTLLVSMTGGGRGARVAIEVGALAG